MQLLIDLFCAKFVDKIGYRVAIVISEVCSFENKEATMSLLHSFYCWGSVGTIVISTAFFAIFGMDSWRWLAVIWALIPAYNLYNFATCPIVPIVEDGQGMGIRQLGRKPLFWVAICLMVCAGASGMLCVVCYLMASLSSNPVIGLIGCTMCGFSVGIMWPGTISISSKRFQHVLTRENRRDVFTYRSRRCL